MALLTDTAGAVHAQAEQAPAVVPVSAQPFPHSPHPTPRSDLRTGDCWKVAIVFPGEVVNPRFPVMDSRDTHSPVVAPSGVSPHQNRLMLTLRPQRA